MDEVVHETVRHGKSPSWADGVRSANPKLRPWSESPVPPVVAPFETSVVLVTTGESKENEFGMKPTTGKLLAPGRTPRFGVTVIATESLPSSKMRDAGSEHESVVHDCQDTEEHCRLPTRAVADGSF
jgi:hypothetical protein